MPGKFKAALPRILLVLHVLASLLLLLSVLLPLLHPQAFWPSGLAGLFFVPLLVLSSCFIPLWWWYKKKYYWLSALTLLPCIPAMGVSFGLHLFRQQHVEKKDSGFTIMSFNASSMGMKHLQEDSVEQRDIYNMLQTANPDVLCMQEFYTSAPAKDRTDHLSLIQERLGYGDHFFTNDGTFYYICHLGIVLYSRFPIIDTLRIPLDSTNEGSGNSVLQADLRIHDDTVRVLAIQLKSYMFREGEYQDIRRIKALRDVTFSATRRVLNKMHPTLARRAREADTLQALIARSPYPVVLCGDFNDVPVSYTYRTISHHMNDAFLSQGWGLGRTFHALSPTLRIDYILTQPAFKIDGYETFPHKGFEHVPIMAALSLHR